MVPDWSGYLTFRPAFSDVMDARYYTPEWLDGRILDGSARFWRTDTSAIVAELRTYPTGAVDLHGLVAAGDAGEIATALIPQAEAWGREQGCVAAIIESREAWARVLRASGYEVHQVAVRKEL